jgi:methylenetetrahydrofolate dehydrogenase (NADP+)/methenyltetrahydrofolate cyclohydrolase
MRGELAAEIATLKGRGVTPGLAAVLVGDNPASHTYVRMKGKACDEAGLYHETVELTAGTSERELLALVDRLNGCTASIPARTWTAFTRRTSARS